MDRLKDNIYITTSVNLWLVAEITKLFAEEKAIIITTDYNPVNRW